MNLQKMLGLLDDDGVENLRRAVEIGRWPDGSKVDKDQRELCLQALIAYEANNVPEEQRAGYMPPAQCASKSDEVQPLDIKKLH